MFFNYLAQTKNYMNSNNQLRDARESYKILKSNILLNLEISLVSLNL